MRRLVLALTLLWLTLSGAARAHEITFSHVDIALTAQATSVRATLPIKALLHELPSPLPPGTTEQSLAANPLPADQRAALSALLTRRLRLTADGAAVPLTIEAVRPAGADIALTARAAAVEGPLRVDANLFPDDGLAKIFVTVSRDGALAGQYALDRQDAAFTIRDQTLIQVIGEFIVQGVRHIAIGPDHILFVISLVLLGGRLLTQVKIVTAFTVAHSITLTLATLHLVNPPARWVESLIALSIVLVGLHNLRELRRAPDAAPARHDPRAALAYAFGLIHGFGFASVLGDLDLPQDALAWSLAAFNIGVELGQAAIVLTAAPLLWALRRYVPPRVAQAVLMVVAGAVVVMGAVWLVQRVAGV